MRKRSDRSTYFPTTWGKHKISGSLLNGKEMAGAIASHGTGQVAYGIEDTVEKVEGWVLELGGNVIVRKKGKGFPNGLYT